MVPSIGGGVFLEQTRLPPIVLFSTKLSTDVLPVSSTLPPTWFPDKEMKLGLELATKRVPPINTPPKVTSPVMPVTDTLLGMLAAAGKLGWMKITKAPTANSEPLTVNVALPRSNSLAPEPTVILPVTVTVPLLLTVQVAPVGTLTAA